MTYYVTCPKCGKEYSTVPGFPQIRTEDDVERSFRNHLTGKHCLKGEAYKKAYKEAKRERR